jgi:hypothetical protein
MQKVIPLKIYYSKKKGGLLLMAKSKDTKKETKKAKKVTKVKVDKEAKNTKKK